MRLIIRIRELIKRFLKIKILSVLILLIAFILLLTNPTLKDFKDVAPTKVMVIENYGYCNKLILNHRKVKNYLLFSHYEFSFACIKTGKKEDKYEGSSHFYYIGILGNFYQPQYYYDVKTYNLQKIWGK
jgi:hypothetical protein